MGSGLPQPWGLALGHKRSAGYSRAQLLVLLASVAAIVFGLFMASAKSRKPDPSDEPDHLQIELEEAQRRLYFSLDQDDHLRIRRTSLADEWHASKDSAANVVTESFDAWQGRTVCADFVDEKFGPMDVKVVVAGWSEIVKLCRDDLDNRVTDRDYPIWWTIAAHGSKNEVREPVHCSAGSVDFPHTVVKVFKHETTFRANAPPNMRTISSCSSCSGLPAKLQLAAAGSAMNRAL